MCKTSLCINYVQMFRMLAVLAHLVHEAKRSDAFIFSDPGMARA